ncbi:ParB/RepB/Spo0J family partition protein [Paraburkholderia fungorum]|jgi:hypothetical protein|uniref:ParB/RepB/Spo0J family partition protein n=1 Tax=Paraburkholderia fungorum TaxID=134537 RepID=UPI00248D6CAA|nr:ParB/RepB/Spo0J family partition protein [Paraburkholderia fungorum]
MTNPVLDIERAEYLKARIASSKTFGDLAAWPRADKRLPSVELEVEWVRFSTLNHRTKAEQKREIQQQNAPGLFSSDPLGKRAQDAQYKILCSQSGFDDLKADLKKRRQQEPAVVTAEGVLINGNRRTAALRSLFKEDAHLDARYVRCLVLPDDASIGEILDLETELQIARDFKEEYSWINEALLIEELYALENRDFDRLAKKMHRSPVDVRGMYEKIQQVNQLVELSQGTRFHIDFEEHESAFDELTKHIKNKPRKEAESVRAAYFLGTLSGVTYRDLRNLRLPEASELVVREIIRDPSTAPLLDMGNTSDGGGESLIDDVLGAGAKDPLSSILSLLAEKRSSELVSLPTGGDVPVADLFRSLKGKIEAAAREAREEQRDQNALEAPVARLEGAILEIGRAVQALPRARVLSDWNESAFSKKLDELKSALQLLEQQQ